jgi:hypothetical protein
MTFGQFTHALRCRACRRLWLRDLWQVIKSYRARRLRA